MCRTISVPSLSDPVHRCMPWLVPRSLSWAMIGPIPEVDMEPSEQGARDITVVPVAGRLDSQTAPHLGQRLDELLHGGRTLLLIEASELQYIGSAGLQA